jgi:hypothetical protein
MDQWPEAEIITFSVAMTYGGFDPEFAIQDWGFDVELRRSLSNPEARVPNPESRYILLAV